MFLKAVPRDYGRNGLGANDGTGRGVQFGRFDVTKITINSVEEASRLALPLDSRYHFAICVDPSTSSTGIIVGCLETKEPFYFIALERDRKTPAENDYAYYNEMVKVLIEGWINRSYDVTTGVSNIQHIIAEQPVFIRKKQTPANYAKQKASFDLFKSLANSHDINFIGVTAPEWRKAFLTQYKQAMGLDLRKDNKKEVHQITTKYFQEITLLPYDTSDAFGIWYYFINVLNSDVNLLVANNSTHRELNHNIIFSIMGYERVNDYINQRLELRRQKFPEVQAKEFVYNPKLSAEDNIRTFTSSNNKVTRSNIYYSQLTPSISIMGELYRFRHVIGKISATTPIYLVGFRENI